MSLIGLYILTHGIQTSMHHDIKPCMAVRHREAEEAQDSCRSASDALKYHFLVNSPSLAVQLVAGLLQVLRVQHSKPTECSSPKVNCVSTLAIVMVMIKKVTSAHIVRE